MNNNIIFSFTQIGDLVIEKILFESYYPILFTCRSDRHVLYLCVCCLIEYGNKKYLVTEVNPKTIVEMLEDKITMREAFLKDCGQRYTISFNGSIPSITEDWDPNNSIFLPTSGVFINSEENEFDEEINYYNYLGEFKMFRKAPTFMRGPF